MPLKQAAIGEMKSEWVLRLERQALA